MRLLLATSAILVLATRGFAADRYHVVTPSFGCVVPWTTWVINDQRDLRRHEPEWLQHVITRGQCRLISPIQEWQEIGSTGRLLLLRPVPPRDDLPPLLFRPFDLRHGEVGSVPVVPATVPDRPAPVLEQPLPPLPSPASPSPTLPLPDPAAAARATLPPPPALPAPATTAAPAAPAPPDTGPGGPATLAVPEPASPPPATSQAPTAPVPTPAPIIAPTVPVAPPVAPGVAPAVAEAGIGVDGTVVVAAIVALLAIVSGLVWMLRRRLAIRRQDRLMAEWLDTEELSRPSGSDIAPSAIDSDKYRERCLEFLVEAGWTARSCFPGSGLTADIMARRDGRLLTVQCRPSSHPLEAEVVREALVVRAAQGATLAAVVSNAGYSKAARSLAATSGVLLLHDTELPEFVS